MTILFSSRSSKITKPESIKFICIIAIIIFIGQDCGVCCRDESAFREKSPIREDDISRCYSIDTGYVWCELFCEIYRVGRAGGRTNCAGEEPHCFFNETIKTEEIVNGMFSPAFFWDDANYLFSEWFDILGVRREEEQGTC